MKVLRCFDCKKLLKELTQRLDKQTGKVHIEGYCKECACYTRITIEEDEDES